MKNHPIPAALEPATRTERRRVRVPAFEIDLRLDEELLDPRPRARASIILDIEFDGKVTVPYRYRPVESDEGARTTYLEDAAIVYGSKVVGGSSAIQAFEQGPEVVEQTRLPIELEGQEELS